MKQRDNLLRLKRFRIGELKRQMTTLAAMTGGVERKLSDLEESVARERQRANDSDIGRLAFPSFLRAMDSRRENLKATLRELERERSQAELELDRVCEELKILELAAEQEMRRGADAELRKSRLRVDDLAMSRHLRKQALRQI
jgi:flagellar biosynthesis chaperone FliJ